LWSADAAPVAELPRSDLDGAIEVARIVVREPARRHVLPRGSVQRLDGPVPDDALTWPAA
jgi:hypothetical protein